MHRKQGLCLILVLVTLCSLFTPFACADSWGNQSIDKRWLGTYREGYNELTIDNINGKTIQFHVVFHRLHDQYSTATLSSDGAAYFPAPSSGGFSGKLEFIGDSVVLSVEDTLFSDSYFGCSAIRYLGGEMHWFSKPSFIISQVSRLPNNYRGVFFSTATATSSLTENGITFKAEYAIDDKSTFQRPWVEGVYGSGINEKLTLYFKNTTTIQALSFRLGYARDQDRYEKNNRPSWLGLTFTDGTDTDWWFEDKNEEQIIVFSEPVTTDSIVITILDVYRGSQCDDTCIYQVKAFSPY